MFSLLRSNFERRIHLADEEFDHCKTFFTPKKVRKKQFILQEGEGCKHVTFVTSGCLRAHTVDSNGEEHVIQFAIRRLVDFGPPEFPDGQTRCLQHRRGGRL
ncbi:MAG: cyclic nucleotide-binding domain-containing protein [Acidobacteriia bacterium]|nr:cyclic nucleotide-binding domain-containing protein [Terriglobia bacterium]